MSPSNPMPIALPGECRKAAKLFSAFADPNKGLDNVIPPHVLRKSKGFAFLTVVKAGFLFSARAGSGCVIARLPDGSWSAPSAVGTAGGGVGFQAGVEMAEFLIILNSRAAVASFMAAGSLTVGGNMSVAAGPLGRNVEGTGSLSSKGKVSAMYSYSRTKGLFGGASLEGSVIVERSDANAKAYGADVTAKQLLSGQVDVPSFAEVLIDTISRKCGSSAEWKAQVEEDEDGFRPDPSRGYSFTSSFASGGSNAPTPEKKGKLGGLGSIGRSRSSSGVGGGGPSENGYGDLRDDSNRDPFAGGVESGHSSGPRFDTSSTPRFEHHFTSDVPSSQDDYTWSSATGAAIGKTSKSAKLTKSRSSHGMSRGNSRDLLDFGSSGGGSDDKQPQWSAEAAPADPRDSFDSLDADTGSRYTGYSGYTGYGDDDDDADRRYDDTSSRRDGARRFRSSTVTSNSSTSRPSLFARARSASSPWASFRGSSSSKKNSRSASPAAAPYDDHGLSTVPSYDSYDEPTRDYTSRSAADSKPWDSEDEDLNRPKPTVPSSSRNNAAFDSPSNIRTTARGDPFDFSQVEADFQTATSGPRLRGAGGGSGPARDIVNPFAPASKPTPSRSRSSTTGGGICQALALFDFPGVEPTDLPFKKGDVVTIIAQDDEEWWKGRLKLVEGTVPRNYLEIL